MITSIAPTTGFMPPHERHVPGIMRSYIHTFLIDGNEIIIQHELPKVTFWLWGLPR